MPEYDFGNGKVDIYVRDEDVSIDFTNDEVIDKADLIEFIKSENVITLDKLHKFISTPARLNIYDFAGKSMCLLKFLFKNRKQDLRNILQKALDDLD